MSGPLHDSNLTEAAFTAVETRSGLCLRPAVANDVPAIVDLLQACGSGRVVTPTAEAWYWRHVRSPFGPSFVHVAEQDGELVAVSAWARWVWTRRGDVVRGARAAETAVHPAYRGAGLFEALTQLLLRRAGRAGCVEVSAAPHPAVGVGYLTLGWHSFGRVALASRGVWSRGRYCPAQVVPIALAVQAA